MRKFKTAIIMLTALIALSGCGGKNPPANPASTTPVMIEEETQVEINVVTSYGSDDGNRQNYERAFKDYEAQTGNIVKDNSAISNEAWKTQILSDFENDSEPDVLFFFSGTDSNKMVSDGKVVSIEEIRTVYPDYAANMNDFMMEKSPIDGKIYAVPVNGYWEGLYVNKRVLADCGVEVPSASTSWDNFLADCQKIADKGYTPIAASLKEVPHYWFEFCVFNNGTVAAHKNLPESSSDSVGNSWVAGLYDIKELYEKGYFPENTTTAANADTDTLMIDNKAAFMIDGSWKMGWLAENAADINDFTVTYVPGKGERKSTDIIGGISMGYFITRKAWDNPEKQAACVEFVQAMTTDEVVATFGVTAFTALKEKIQAPSNASNLVKDALEMAGGLTNIVPATADGLSPNSRSDLFGNITNIVEGEMSAEDAINRCLEM